MRGDLNSTKRKPQVRRWESDEGVAAAETTAREEWKIVSAGDCGFSKQSRARLCVQKRGNKSHSSITVEEHNSPPEYHNSIRNAPDSIKNTTIPSRTP